MQTFSNQETRFSKRKEKKKFIKNMDEFNKK